jgi:hypothetical protein
VVATCGNFNLDPLNERIERRRILWARERPRGDCSAESPADGIADHVAKRGAKERVAGERGGALSSVWGDPVFCHG